MLRSASTKSYSLNNHTEEEVCKLLQKCHQILHIILRYNLPPKLTTRALPAQYLFWGSSRLGGALSGYAYGLTSVNNSSKKAIIGLLYFTQT